MEGIIHSILELIRSVGGLLVLIYVLLPLYNSIKAWNTDKKIDELKEQCEALRSELQLKQASEDGSDVQSHTQKKEEGIQALDEQVHVDDRAAEHKLSSATIREGRSGSSNSIEKVLGTKLIVWLGGLSFIVAGVFLLKYSIDNDLLNPTMRVLGGLILGILLLFTSLKVRKRDVVSEKKISQSLAGAGLSILYGSCWAAYSLYQLVPGVVAFVAMTIITLTALMLALRYGSAIAIIGIGSAYLTPLLIGSKNPSLGVFFIYLYSMFAATMYLIHRQKWWWLSIPSFILVFLWTIAWVLGNDYQQDNAIWIGIFLLAVSFTIFYSTRRKLEDSLDSKVSVSHLHSTHGVYGLFSKYYLIIFNVVALSANILLVGILLARSGLGPAEWVYYAILAFGGMGMAYFNNRVYGFVPILTMAVNVVMVSTWNTTDAIGHGLLFVSYAALYIIPSYFLIWRSQVPLLWASLLAATSFGFFFGAYFVLSNTEGLFSSPYIWMLVSALLTAGSLFIIAKTYSKYDSDIVENRKKIMALFAITASSYISIFLTIGVEREFLATAFSLEMFLIAVIYRHTGISVLKAVITILGIGCLLLIAPQLINLLLDIIYLTFSLNSIQNTFDDSSLYLNPLFFLFVPSLMFYMVAIVLRNYKDGYKSIKSIKSIRNTRNTRNNNPVRIYYSELVFTILVSSFVLLFTFGLLVESENLIKLVPYEKGIVINVLFGCTFLFGYLYNKYHRLAFRHATQAAGAVTLFFLVVVSLLATNPFFISQSQHYATSWGEFISAIVTIYVLPLSWLIAMHILGTIGGIGRVQSISIDESFDPEILGKLIANLVLFTLTNIVVKSLFHGIEVTDIVTSDFELYSFSLCWLLFGLGMLLYGIHRGDQFYRLASLVLLLITTGKIFIVDASNLENLYRVFSFIGLGVAAIGISWIYSKYVFNR